jgi:phosphatidylserine decarboxylase
MKSPQQKRFTLAKEGTPIILVTGALAIIFWCAAALTNSGLLCWTAVVLTIFAALLVFLFREPVRINTNLTALDIISPADGKVVGITAVDEPQFLKTKAVRISIFLSLLDVHVNWLPMSGVVKHKQAFDGKFMPAFIARASEKNKRVAVGIESDDGFCITVVQITGFVARRIRCYLTPGQKAERGERYGMIYFGSRVDIFVPPDTTINVRKGDRVHGGITVIGQKQNRHATDKISTP